MRRSTKSESRAYAVDRLFQDALAAGLNRHNEGGSLLKIAAAFSPEERRQLSVAIAEVIQTEVAAEHFDVETSDAGQLTPDGFHSAILRMRRDGDIDKIVFLRVKDTLTDGVIPLVGLAVAAWSGDLSKLITPAAQSIKSLWTNLITLTRKKDAAAIDVYEALTISRAMARAAGGGFPATSEITARVAMEPIAVVAALKRLAKLKLIEVQAWGGDVDDESHIGNTWTVRM